MHKSIIRVGADMYIKVPVLLNDGKADIAAILAWTEQTANEVAAELSTDQALVAAELNAVLSKTKPNFRDSTEIALFTMIQRARLAKDLTDGVERTIDEETARTARLEEVLGEYLRSTPERFLVMRGVQGRASGVLIRNVEGEIRRNADGSPDYDDEGNEVPVQRWSDVEWANLRAKHEERAAAKEAKKAERAEKKGTKVQDPTAKGLTNLQRMAQGI